MKSFIAFLMVMLVVWSCNSSSKKSNNNTINNTNNTLNNTNNTNNTNNLNNTNNTNNTNHQVQAELDMRCADAERIGIIEIGSYENGPLQVFADVQNRKPLRRTEVKLSDTHCTFNEELPPGFCNNCPTDKWCTHDSECVDIPVTVPNLQLELTDGTEIQTFEPQYGEGIYGNITLSGDTFGVRITWGSDFEVTLTPVQVPAPLISIQAVLQGGHDQPEALDLSWTISQDSVQIYTYIPINHHAAGITNTQCMISADEGNLHIDGAMLRPLAVVTGLEFQDVWHARFAAAYVEGGCVEFRLFRSHFPAFQK